MAAYELTAVNLDLCAPTQSPPPVLQTLQDAAAYLTVTEEQVLGFVRDGSLKFINTGRGQKRPRYRFDKADLDAFIAQRRQQQQGKQSSWDSTRTHAQRRSTSTSGCEVIGFTALRAAQAAKKPTK